MLKKNKVLFIINQLDKIYPEVSAPLKHSNKATVKAVIRNNKSVNKVNEGM